MFLLRAASTTQNGSPAGSEKGPVSEGLSENTGAFLSASQGAFREHSGTQVGRGFSSNCAFRI